MNLGASRLRVDNRPMLFANPNCPRVCSHSHSGLSVMLLIRFSSFLADSRHLNERFFDTP